MPIHARCGTTRRFRRSLRSRAAVRTISTSTLVKRRSSFGRRTNPTPRQSRERVFACTSARVATSPIVRCRSGASRISIVERLQPATLGRGVDLVDRLAPSRSNRSISACFTAGSLTRRRAAYPLVRPVRPSRSRNHRQLGQRQRNLGPHGAERTAWSSSRVSVRSRSRTTSARCRSRCESLREHARPTR